MASYDAKGFAGTGNNRFSANQDSPSGRPSNGDARKSKPFRPTTIRQLLAAQRVGDGAFVIDGIEIGQVTVIGVVLSSDISQGPNQGNLQCTYKICDGTGLMTVRTWAESAQDNNAYIRASGTVSAFQNGVSITGIVRPVSNSSEVPYHLMDCALTHLRITKGTRTPGVAIQQQQMQAIHQPLQQQVYGMAAAHTAAPQAHAGSARDLILGIIRAAGGNGASVQSITDAVKSYGYSAEVRDVIRSLNAEGSVFTQNNTIFISNK